MSTIPHYIVINNLIHTHTHIYIYIYTHTQLAVCIYVGFSLSVSNPSIYLRVARESRPHKAGLESELIVSAQKC